MNQVNTVILQQCYIAGAFPYNKAYKINQGARVGHRSRNKSTIINNTENQSKVLKLLRFEKF